VIWIHTQYTPREEGIEMIANTLGIDKSKISVPKARDVEKLLMTQQIPDEINKALSKKGKSLLVCMAGNTSLMAVKVLADKGIVTESLDGGISVLAQGKGKQIPELIKIATE
jgi:rhodanese-related sulfurtransferase